VPTPLTIIDGIDKLPTGSRTRFWASGEERSDRSANWREHEHQNLDQEEAIITLRGLLRDSVARRLGNEREVGVFLSGGLDSSLIAALLVDLGVKVHLYTLDFGPPFDVELPVAKQVAAHLGQELNIVPAHPAQIEAALVPTAAALSQPFGDGVTVPIFLLGQEAAGRVGTIFNGEGGDQLFGGWTSKPMIAAELYGGNGYDREQAYLNTYHRFFGLTEQMYTKRAQSVAGPADPGHWIRDALNAEGFSTLLHRLRAVNLWLKGAQNILPRATQLADAHGLRVRSPFFDRALTEWTFGLPSELLLQGACEKYLLKKAAEPYLPPDVVWREKRGMGVPTTQWCLGPLKREVRRRLSSGRLKRDGWFNPTAIKELRRGNDEPGEFRYRRVGEKLWALLMLHTWLDTREKPVPWPSSSSNGG
jgi:asparagine synthase (glutamine-hydrolysing)